MRIFVSVVILFIFIDDICAQKSTNSYLILNEAISASKIQNKKIIIVFTSSWCNRCRELKDSILNDNLSQYKLKEIFDSRYIIRYMNVYESDPLKETSGAKVFLSSFVRDNEVSLPLYLVFDAEMNLVGDSFMYKDTTALGSRINIGFPIYQDEIEAFIDLVSKTSTINTYDSDRIRRKLTRLR